MIVSDYDKNDDGFWHWFAGFVAGEGCFYSVIDRRTGLVQARFMIHLRLDDMDILLETQERLGFGNLYQKPSYRDGDKPAIQIQIAQNGELIRLIEIFDKHPIRAKKQRDYDIWRELVLTCSVDPAHRDRRRSEYLHHKLRFVKQYQNQDEQEEDTQDTPEQLVLEL